MRGRGSTVSVRQGEENYPVPVADWTDMPPATVWRQWPEEIQKRYLKDLDAERAQRVKDAAHVRLMDRPPHISTVLVTIICMGTAGYCAQIHEPTPASVIGGTSVVAIAGLVMTGRREGE